jgi:hypothetical protein
VTVADLHRNESEHRIRGEPHTVSVPATGGEHTKQERKIDEILPKQAVRRAVRRAALAMRPRWRRDHPLQMVGRAALAGAVVARVRLRGAS